MLSEIENRRSIRKYKDMPVSKQDIQKIINAGMLAPSSKNRQPWRFIVISGKAKSEMLLAMKNGIEREKKEPLLPESSHHIKAAEYTVNIMEQAPVIIFVINTLGLDLEAQLSTEERVYEICNAQSIGAAIQNMTLEATKLGLGSLWICDTYFAYKELKSWLDTDGELFAALAVGYADEKPNARPRKSIKDIVKWCK